ncbi:MAG TPA: DUF2807 domain-containing protein [Allosphingosinicella sp.]|jgi:hypothetical protein
MIRLAAIALLGFSLLGFAVPAIAATPVPVTAFEGIALVGGGDVTIRRGPVHRVTVLGGDLTKGEIKVERGSLVIRSCRRSCTNNRLTVAVETPEIEALSLHGGGSMRAARGFSGQHSLSASVNGGGTIDLAAVEAETVSASINGGGRILTDARRDLAVSINGDGRVTYLADPQISVSIQGRGTVTRADDGQ